MCAKLILLRKRIRNWLKDGYECTIYVYTKINIEDYLARSEAKIDKEYSEERQKIRQYIRKDDLAAKRDGGVIDWGYLLNASDGW